MDANAYTQILSSFTEAKKIVYIAQVSNHQPVRVVSKFHMVGQLIDDIKLCFFKSFNAYHILSNIIDKSLGTVGRLLLQGHSRRPK